MELRILWLAVRRGLWLAVPLAVLGGLAGSLVAPEPSTVPRASVQLLLADNPNASPQSADRSALRLAAVVTSDAVLDTALADTTGMTDVDELRESVEVTTEAGRDVVVVSVAGDTDEAAMANVSAVAESFVSTLRTSQRAPTQRRLDETTAAVEAAVTDLTAAQVALAADPEDGSALAARDAATARYTALLTDQSALARQLDGFDDPVSELSSAQLDPVAEDGAAKYVVAGAVAGLMAGIVLAMLWMGRSGTVNGVDEAASILQRDITFRLPRVSTRATRPSGLGPGAGHGDYWRIVSELAVLAELSRRPGKSLLVQVASASGTPVDREFAPALAAVFSAGGGTTVLVDADPDSVHTGDISRIQRPAADHDLETAASAATAVVLADRFVDDGSSDLEHTLKRLRHGTDVTVIDAGPLTSSPTAVRVGRHVDVIILLVPSRHQSVAALRSVRLSIATSIATPIVPVWASVGRRRRG